MQKQATTTSKPQAPATTGVITVLATSNPKAPNSRSAARFALYKTGQTVAAYQAACVATGQPNAKRNATADLQWDLARGYIAVSGMAPTKAALAAAPSKAKA